jgi:hypothetical protein
MEDEARVAVAERQIGLTRRADVLGSTSHVKAGSRQQAAVQAEWMKVKYM